MSRTGVRVFFSLLVLSLSLLLPVARAVPAQTRGDFVQVRGELLVFRGKPIKLKGINFYPKDYAWTAMWSRWDGQAVRRDLSRAQELGVNSVRVLVPYKYTYGWTSKSTGEVKPEYLNRLQQFVQIAGEMNLKVIVALFDFYDPSDESASVAIGRNLLYLQGIIPTFANDDRILAWDLHNEPENYETWRDTRDPAAFIAWMSRMRDEIRRLDPNHLITVGMGQFDNLFVADATGAPPLGKQAPGRTAADLSDFLSFHSYNPGSIDWQIAYIKGQSNKPVVLQETGWPSGPPCASPAYDENQQVLLYDLILKGARKADIAGLMLWQLWDFIPGASRGGGKESYEDYFGLLKRDGTWKPAMPLFRDGWPGPGSTAAADPLPSAITSSFPLTKQPPPGPPTDPLYVPPIYFPETGHYLYGSFRDYWKRFGGLEIFGYPLTEQRIEGDLLVQYFERARFEYHPENEKKGPAWDALDKATRLKLTIQLTRLGASLVDTRTASKGYPAVDVSLVPPGGTRFPETGHSISGKLAEYWWSHNGLTNFGYPLSEPVQEVSQANGKTYTVQYFERTRLELHPEYAGTPYEVLLGLMGRELLASKGCR